MRSKKEFEEERHFGIQKFDTAEEAFNVMEGSWGERGTDSKSSVFIATDEQFEKAILLRAAEKYVEFKEGRITLEECNRALMRSEDFTDYLVDFDFLLLSKRTNSYFTSRMSFKDDGCNTWNDRQWGYFTELMEAYSFKQNVEEAVAMVDALWDDYGYDVINEICAEKEICY